MSGVCVRRPWLGPVTPFFVDGFRLRLVCSPGSKRNAFGLVDLAVCLASVQSRAGHPNLGKDSPLTASVAATFYNLYNFRGLERGTRGEGGLQAVKRVN